MTPITWLSFIGGLTLLLLGAELLVRGASRLASAVGISPLVVGLTVVAFGTGSPELAVSLRSAWNGQGDLAIGNVVGSNIANVLLVLGSSALAAPLVVSARVIRLDVPVMVLVSSALLLLAIDGRIGRIEGLVLFTTFTVYTLFLIRQSRKEGRAVEEEYRRHYERPGRRPRLPLQVGLVVSGLVLLVLGSRWLVDAAIVIARELDVSELVIGLTIVAVGTSLPELATSIVASIRGERDIAVGNAVGSNLFNIMAVLGLTGMVMPGGLNVSRRVLHFDLPFMIAAAIACLPIFFSGYRISRWEGGLFLAYYVAYIAWLGLAASGHEALPVFSSVMLLFVVPLTVATMVVMVWRGLRADRTR